MKQLLFENGRYVKVFHLKLGKVYRLTTQFKNSDTCVFIQTSKKGFNFINLRNAKCRFTKALYQEYSAKKIIGRRQVVFDIQIPDQISTIEELNQKEIKKLRCFGGLYLYTPQKTMRQHKIDEKHRVENEEKLRLEKEKRSIEENTFDNPISRMELDI